MTLCRCPGRRGLELSRATRQQRRETGESCRMSSLGCSWPPKWNEDRRADGRIARHHQRVFVDAFENLGLHYFIRAAGYRDLASMEQHDLAGEPRHQVQLVADDEHGASCTRQMLEQLERLHLVTD